MEAMADEWTKNSQVAQDHFLVMDDVRGRVVVLLVEEALMRGASWR